MRRAAALVGLFVALFAMTVEARPRAPLVMEGKRALLERVLSRPGALLHVSPGAAPVAKAPPLSFFYVYGRAIIAGEDWLEIAPGAAGEDLRWARADSLMPWRQTLVLSFTHRAERPRALIFGGPDSLAAAVEGTDPAAAAAALRAAAEAREDARARGGAAPAAHDDIVALEPAQPADRRARFYFLPIFEHRLAVFADGRETLLAKVAIAKPEPSAAPALQPVLALAPAAPRERGFRAGVALVVDTTRSMGPYIARMKQAVERVHARVAGSAMGGRVSFGLVSYRDSTAAAPGLDYVARIHASLAEGADPATFRARMDELKEAKASSKDFHEDAFTGVHDAITGLDWEGFDARFVVLVTDAGARGPGDPLSATGLGPDEIRLLAADRGVAVIALHALTPAGVRDHDRAAAQYARATWREEAKGSLYFAAENGDVEALGRQADRIGDAIVGLIEAAERGRLVEPSSPVAASAQPEELETMRRVGLVGRAMQLAWLGRESGSEAPDLFEGWIADRDFADPNLATIDVGVLLTKDQLSDLSATLVAIVEAGENTIIEPTDFFSQLKSAAAAMSRRPGAVGSDGRRLAETGLIGEYLEGLPYTSRIMELTEDDWLAKSFAEQRQFLDELNAKIRLYRDFHDDVERWIALDDARVKGQAIAPIPLEALP